MDCTKEHCTSPALCIGMFLNAMLKDFHLLTVKEFYNFN